MAAQKPQAPDDIASASAVEEHVDRAAEELTGITVSWIEQSKDLINAVQCNLKYYIELQMNRDVKCDMESFLRFMKTENTEKVQRPSAQIHRDAVSDRPGTPANVQEQSSIKTLPTKARVKPEVLSPPTCSSCNVTSPPVAPVRAGNVTIRRKTPKCKYFENELVKTQITCLAGVQQGTCGSTVTKPGTKCRSVLPRQKVVHETQYTIEDASMVEPSVSDVEPDTQPPMMPVSGASSNRSTPRKVQCDYSLASNHSLTVAAQIHRDAVSVRPVDYFVRHCVTDDQNATAKLYASVRPTRIFIGTHQFVPTENVYFNSKGITIVAPSVKKATENITLSIQTQELMKIVFNFTPTESKIFIYVLNTCGSYIRDRLEMQNANPDNSQPFFSPTATKEYYKQIVLLLDAVPEETKSVIKSIFVASTHDNISLRDANLLLDRCSFPTQLGSKVSSLGNRSTVEDPKNSIRAILIYPPGTGGISIHTEDYMCLAIGQYLNDVIIDFYLKFLLTEQLSKDQRLRTHVFSTFFYKCLMKPTDQAAETTQMTASQKRHAHVKRWTKSVNLFQKDFIIIPINENSHWFLAIVCYPSLKGPVESDLASEDSEKETNSQPSQTPTNSSSEKPKQVPVKQPCILIFDSLASTSRSHVVATLRDYLTCEYKAKMGDQTTHTFTKDTIPGHSVKVPQQNNFTDCGLFLLQYVEQFFKDPIRDYRIPIKHLINWFDTMVVTRKREEISVLLIDLIKKINPRQLPLPDIKFPTLNGKLLDIEDTFNEEGLKKMKRQMGIQ